MELKVKEITLPEALTFNYEELKSELMAKAEHYENLVFTSNQLTEAKAERAKLSKLKKALNDERIKREKEYMQPFNDFKAKITEIIGIIDRPAQAIDKQVKSFEEAEKEKKLAEILHFYNDVEKPEWLDIKLIFNDKWLNASAKMSSVEKEIKEKIEQVAKDLDTLRQLPEFAFEATEEYKQSLDLNKAIAEGHRLSEMQKRKAELEAERKKVAEKPVEEVKSESTGEAEKQPENRTWVSFRAFLTVDDATALKEFFESRNIEFQAI